MPRRKKIEIADAIEEPSLQNIKEYHLALKMTDVNTTMETCDLLLRINYCLQKGGAQYTIKDAATIIARVKERWKDGIVDVALNDY